MSAATGVVTGTSWLTKEGSQKRRSPGGDKGLGSAQVLKRGRYWDQHLVGPRRRGPLGWSRVKYSRGAGGADQLSRTTWSAGAQSLAWEPRRGTRYYGGGPGTAEGS